MPSPTLDALRARYPKLRENTDEEITVALGKKYPKLAQDDPAFAKDYSLYTRNPVAGAVEDLGKSFIASAVYDTGTAGWSVIENVAKMFSTEMAEWARENADNASVMSQKLRESGDLAFGVTDASFDRGVDQDSTLSKIGSGAGSLVPMAAGGVGVAAGAARALGVGLSAIPKAAQLGAAATSYSISGLQSFGSTYQEARKGYEDQGYSEEEAASKSVIPAATQGTLDLALAVLGGKVADKIGAVDLERLWLNPAFKEGIDKIAKGSSLLAGAKPILKSAATEGSEEAASSFIGQYLIARQTYNPDVTFSEALNEAWDSFVVGGVLGGGLAGRPGYRAYKQRKSASEEAKRNTIRETSPQVARRLDEIDAQNEQQVINDVLPDDAQQPIDDPARRFAEANKDVQMGGDRPINELPVLPAELVREREQLIANEYEQRQKQRADQEEATRQARLEEMRKRDEEVARSRMQLETDPEAVQDVEVAEIQRVIEGQSTIQQAAQPLNTAQLAEAAEAELEIDRLNDTQRKAVNRLLDRKAQLIADSIDANPLQLDGILDEMESIDSNLSRLIPGVPEGVQKITPEQLTQFQQPYINQPSAELESEPSLPEEPPAPAYQPLKVSGDSITIEGDIDPQMRGSLRKALNKVKQQFGSIGGVKNIAVVDYNSGAGVYSAARAGNTDTIFINPTRVQQTMENKKFSFDKAIEEEVLHNVDAQAIRSEYNSLLVNGEITSDTTSLSDFIELRYQSIADGMTAEEKATTRANYGADFTDDVHMAQEFSRQLLQKQHTEAITEDALRNPIIRKLFEAIERFLSGAKGLSGRAKQHLEQVSDFLLDSYKAEVVDAAVAEEQQAAAIEAKRQEAKNKYDADEKRNADALEAMDLINQAINIVHTSGLVGSNGRGPKPGSMQADEVYGKALEAWVQREPVGDPEVDGDTAKAVPSLSWFKTLVSRKAMDVARAETRAKRGGMDKEMVSLDAPATPDSVDPLQVADTKQQTNLTPYGETIYDLIGSVAGDMGLTNLEHDTLAKIISTEYTNAELAAQRGTSEASVSKQFNNAMSKLRQYAIKQNPEFINQLQEAAKAREAMAGASGKQTNLLYRLLSSMPNLQQTVVSITDKGVSLLRNPLKSVTQKDGGFFDIFAPIIEKDAYINRVTNTMKYRRRDLAAAVKEEYGGYTDSVRMMIDHHLHGDTETFALMPKTEAAVRDMRNQIDALSEYMITEGLVDSELAAVINENLELYVARSYRIFDDPNYDVENADPAVFRAAVNYVARQMASQTITGPNPTNAQLKQAEMSVRDHLAAFKSVGGQKKLMNSGLSKLGKTNLDLFKTKNNDLAPEIRALLGEYTDPDVNYARTITRMAHFVADKKFQTQLATDGLGKIFFNEDDLSRDGFANVKISGDAFGDLNGLYTTPEVKAILDNYNLASNGMLTNNDTWNALLKLNAATKSVKTVGSVMTHARNLIGQPYFWALNGHIWNPDQIASNSATALKAIWADAASTDRTSQAYFNKLTQLGIVGEELTTSELKTTLKQFSEQFNILNNPQAAIQSVFASQLKTKAGKAKDAVVRAYRASDEFGKIVAFEMEVNALSKLPTYAGMSRAEIEKLAAKRVRMTMPTYSEIPPAIRVVAAQPFIGPFMSFAWESGRTQINNLQIIKEEFQNGNTAYAARRAGGHLAVTAAYSVGLKMLSALLGGVGEDEQEAVRELMADYEKNSVFYFSKDDRGKINYTNWSFNNPYSGFTDGLMTLMGLNGMQGDGGIVDHVVNSTLTTLSPFSSETIIAKTMYDVARNEDQYGRKVYNPEKTAIGQWTDIGGHLVKAFLPGTVERAWRRWIPASLGQTIASGESPKMIDELQAELLGIRSRQLDYADKLSRTGFSNKERLSNANRIFNEVAGSRGTQSNDSMLSAYESANDSRYRVFQSIQKQINAARLGGLTDAEIVTALRNSNMSATDIYHAMRGVYRPMDVSTQIQKSARRAGHPVPIGQINVLKRKYLRKSLSNEANETDE